MKKILVVGGYGEVGAHVVRTLLDLNFHVILGGRSESKAMAFIQGLRKSALVTFRSLDISKNSSQWEQAVNDIAAVIMCTDQIDTEFVQYCLGRSLLYLDITADDNFLKQVEALHSFAQKNEACALMSIGLAPGITNLLAKEVVCELGSASQIDIGVLLGVGDSHGDQAVKWTVDNLLDKDKYCAGTKVSFGKPWNTRYAYPFDFSDQHSIQRTMQVPFVRTVLCFSSALLTKTVFWLRHPWIRPWARRCRPLLLWSVSRPLGSDRRYAVSVKGSRQAQSAHYVLKGEVEALVTGVMAAASVQAVLQLKRPAGAFHIHEVLKIADVRGALLNYAGVWIERL